jgi:hypothetical protein
MLLETQTDFEVVDPEADLSGYEAIVLTGAAALTEGEADTLNRFARAGGGLLVLGKSALNKAESAFLLDVGARYLGPARYDVDYTLLGEELGRGLATSPFLNYEAAIRVQPDADAQVLAAIREPYFSRTYAKYCSHLNTPYRIENAAHPAAVRKGTVILLPHRLGKMYYEHGARLHRDLFARVLGLLHSNPMVKTEMPSAGRMSLLHQPRHNRYVAHLLYGPPLQRGRCLVIEDLVPLYEIPLELRVPQKVVSAYLIPGGEVLSLTQVGTAVKAVVPRVRCHQAVAFEYERQA